MAHPNEELLRQGNEAFAAGEVDKVLALFAEDIVWHVGGTSQISGDYQRLEAREANIWHLAGGQATEFWAFLEDDYAADRFFG